MYHSTYACVLGSTTDRERHPAGPLSQLFKHLVLFASGSLQNDRRGGFFGICELVRSSGCKRFSVLTAGLVDAKCLGPKWGEASEHFPNRNDQCMELAIWRDRDPSDKNIRHSQASEAFKHMRRCFRSLGPLPFASNNQSVSSTHLLPRNSFYPDANVHAI